MFQGGMNFIKPHDIVDRFGLGEAAVVADLGAGSGFYSIAAARVVGENGKVYAVDVQKDLLTKLHDGLQLEGLNNLETMWGDIEKIGGSRLATGICDAVFICNTLFQIEHKKELATEAARILRPAGRLLIVDWTDSHNGLGPDAQHIISEEEAQKLFESNGFQLDRAIDVGDHHYGLVMRKANENES